MKPVIERFTEYCKKNEVHILPDDIKFIKSLIINIPRNEHRRVLKQYYDEWICHATLNQDTALNQNYGRFKANEWLRHVANKYMKR